MLSMEWNKLQDARMAMITDLCSLAPSGSLGRTAVVGSTHVVILGFSDSADLELWHLVL